MKNIFILVGGIVLGLIAAAQSNTPSPILADADILAILEQRLGGDAERIGIVVGVIEPQGRRIVAHGRMRAGGMPVAGDTVFEIGSVTKVFTSLLLADMVERGEVALDDRVEDYLPDGVAMPERSGRAITLADLATHTSALPRLPGNMSQADPDNPYADYTVEQLYAFLEGYTLPRDIGAQYEYSNLAVGLLGHVLALAAGTDYETLVRTRIGEPLGLSSTAIALSPDLAERLATGHDARREPVSNWDLPTLAGAGALRSTAEDLLSFLALFLHYEEAGSLTQAADAMLEVRRPAGPVGEIALGWHVANHEAGEMIWHNGGTGGYRSFVGYVPGLNVGVVALTNVSTPGGVDDLGRHLLDSQQPLLPPDSPLLAPPAERTEISLEPEFLERYVGEYEFGPAMILTVTRDGGQLSAQLTGQGALEIYPESETEFFLRAVDAQITFQADDAGRVNALVLHQLGRDQLAQRVGSDADPVDEWFGRRVVEVDTEVFAAYVGDYQLAPGATFTITREGDQLFAQLTGQPRLEVFPASETDYFYKVVDALIRFETDGSGAADALVLHQNGQEMRAERIE